MTALIFTAGVAVGAVFGFIACLAWCVWGKDDAVDGGGDL